MSTVLREVALEDKWTAREGTVLMGGVQALVRVVLEQRRLDRERGLDTAAFVSGYQGSPLAGLDRELQRAKVHLDAAGVVFRPGLNEELAATAVGGTQLLGQLAGRRHDGVTGYWYGKNPGLDRAADAIRHATLSGTAPLGGAVAWIGDDPTAKSSTVPSSCEPMCQSLHLPLLAPGSVQEVLTAGLHAVALSRHAGLWAGVKVVADVADASQVVDLDLARGAIPELPQRAATPPPVLLPPSNLDAEHDLMTLRLDRAREYARAARLNRVVEEPRRPRVALVAAGTAFAALQRALADLGLDATARDALGLRLVQLGMPWPLDAGVVRELTRSVETVLVVEDKLGFVEGLVKEALYRTPAAPEVLGKRDAAGRPLLPERAGLDADDVARALGRVLDLPAQGLRHLERLPFVRAVPAAASPAETRMPTFCSGCPHSTSTRAEPGQLVGVGIGCHTMVALDGGGRRGQLLGMPQMGGEGAQWFGLAPFTDDACFTQNLGDGTFHHSGSLALRAAVAAGVHVTYRLLYNDAVAMTGGQRAEGRLAVPELTRWLALEGVARTIVTTPEPGDYAGVALDPTASVRHRDELQAAAAELAAVPGVTVLLHDDRCATEERRLRTRGELATPAERVVINERVCEGCGDCGEKSTCASVVPVATEFGRKTQVQQSSCNHDRSCLGGDCPSFLLVTPAADPTPRAVPAPPAVPLPECRVGDEVLVRMPGIGGTGVVTVSQVLQMAAHLEGRWAGGLEQVGLAQKGGPVTSDLRFSRAPVVGALRAGRGGVDVLLGLDLLGSAQAATLAVCDPARTRAVVSSSVVPTAAAVADADLAAPSRRRALRKVGAAVAELHELDAQAIADAVFADHMPANMVMAGAAFQHGLLPVGLEAVEQAIRLNGAAVEANLAAFAWGRAAAHDPAAVAALLDATPEPAPLAPWAVTLAERAGLTGELRDVVARRADELRAFQHRGLAERYVDDVAAVAGAEAHAGPGTPVALAYARGLHKLLAYKDEYEVARLHVLPAERARRDAAFGPGAKVELLLHPPVLRALGVERKLRLGPWALPALGVLARARRLRGTPLDPFGRAEVRRVERALPDEYRALVAAALRELRPDTRAQVVALAGLPDVVRGYEAVKLRNVERFRDQARIGLAQLRAPGAPPAASPAATNAAPLLHVIPA